MTEIKDKIEEIILKDTPFVFKKNAQDSQMFIDCIDNLLNCIIQSNRTYALGLFEDLEQLLRFHSSANTPQVVKSFKKMVEEGVL